MPNLPDIALAFALRYPPVQDKLLAKAVKTLGRPVAAQIRTFRGIGANGEGNPKTGTIYVNRWSPYYKKKDLHKLAALLAHEERHVGGGDELAALQTQLAVLEGFGERFKDQDYKKLVRQKLIEQSLTQP